VCVHAAGDLDASAQDYDDLVASPNKWLVLTEFLLDPVKLKNYMLANCEDMLESTSLGKITASYTYVRTNFSDLTVEDTLKICADKAGAWRQFHLCDILHVCGVLPSAVARLNALQRVENVLVLTR
jgi:hypothetical protein